MNVQGLLRGGAVLVAVAVAILLVLQGVPGSPSLGPADGFDLPPTDLDRVAAGDPAPDFSLRALSGDVHTLSAYQGRQNVVLVFYRGHW